MALDTMVTNKVLETATKTPGWTLAKLLIEMSGPKTGIKIGMDTALALAVEYPELAKRWLASQAGSAMPAESLAKFGAALEQGLAEYDEALKAAGEDANMERHL